MKRAAFFAVGLVLLLAAIPAEPSEPNIDLVGLIKDTQKQSTTGGRVAFVWWIPEEFWKASMAQNDSMTPSGIERFVSVLRPYVTVAALAGTIGPMGGATFVDGPTLEESIALVAGNGERFHPLGHEAISADAHNLATTMRPVLTNMLGPMGENLNFFFFPAVTADGEPISVASLPGQFSVEMDGEVFEWELPLGSVLRAKACPIDGREMSGAWTFCPWHGAELEATGNQAVGSSAR